MTDDPKNVAYTAAAEAYISAHPVHGGHANTVLKHATAIVDAAVETGVLHWTDETGQPCHGWL